MFTNLILRTDLTEAVPNIVIILVITLLIFKTILIVREASAAVIERFGKVSIYSCFRFIIDHTIYR